jgi:poly(3-hydroxyalkanoate) synthetase
MVNSVTERVEAIYNDTNAKVSLVGWSMGGLYALDVANTIPNKIQQVITLGSPFGDPRGTSLWSVLRTLSRSKVPIEAQNFEAWKEKARLTAPGVPVSVIYSPTDGIVGTEITQLKGNNVNYVKTKSSHMGFTMNSKVYDDVAHVLTEGFERLTPNQI